MEIGLILRMQPHLRSRFFTVLDSKSRFRSLTLTKTEALPRTNPPLDRERFFRACDVESGYEATTPSCPNLL